MMNKVITNGTGRRALLPGWEVAGKTGTTQAARDAWFVGFTADYVAGVWMGYDDNSPLQGVTGGGLPAEIWKETMQRVTDTMRPTALPMMRAPQVQNVDEFDRRTAPRPQPQRRENAVERILRDLLGGN
jgi:penicillin-binding protein 1A